MLDELRLEQFESRGKGLLNEIRAWARRNGYEVMPARSQSATRVYVFTLEKHSFELHTWHGTGRYGRDFALLSLYSSAIRPTVIKRFTILDTDSIHYPKRTDRGSFRDAAMMAEHARRIEVICAAIRAGLLHDITWDAA